MISCMNHSLLLVLSLLVVLPAPILSGKKHEALLCTYDEINEAYNTGDTFMFCINYIPVMIKENAYVQVGRTTIIHQKFMWKILKSVSIDIVLQVANSLNFSPAIPFNRTKNFMAFPFIPVVITLDYGKVIDLFVEEINDVCMNETVSSGLIPKFYDTNLRMAQSEKPFKREWNLCPKKYKSFCDDGLCDPLLVILWKGTDASGNALTSYYESFMTFSTINKKAIYEDLSEVNYDEEYSQIVENDMEIPKDVFLRINAFKSKKSLRMMEKE